MNNIKSCFQRIFAKAPFLVFFIAMLPIALLNYKSYNGTAFVFVLRYFLCILILTIMSKSKWLNHKPFGFTYFACLIPTCVIFYLINVDITLDFIITYISIGLFICIFK